MEMTTKNPEHSVETEVQAFQGTQFDNKKEKEVWEDRHLLQQAASLIWLLAWRPSRIWFGRAVGGVFIFPLCRTWEILSLVKLVASVQSFKLFVKVVKVWGGSWKWEYLSSIRFYKGRILPENGQRMKDSNEQQCFWRNHKLSEGQDCQ